MRQRSAGRKGLLSVVGILLAATASLAQPGTGPELLLPENPRGLGVAPPPPDPVPGSEPLPAPAPFPRSEPLPLPTPVPAPGTLPIRPPGPPGPGPGRVEIPLPTAGGAKLTRIFSAGPRYRSGFQATFHTLPDQNQALVLTGGVILNVRVVETGELVDIESDQAVVWTNTNAQEVLNKLRSGQRQERDDELEFYLTGNVEIRTRTASESSRLAAGQPLQFQTQVLRASEVYYDAKRNRAIALNAEVQFTQPNQAQVDDDARFRASEVWQLSPQQYRAFEAEVFSSRLPSDPGLKLLLGEARIRQDVVPVRNFFYQPYRNEQGNVETENETTFEGRNSFLEVAGVPVFYLPYARGNVEDPLGPLQAVAFRADQVYGQQILTSWDLLEVFRIRQRRGADGFTASWLGHLDYLSDRGPGFGTTATYRGLQMFGEPTRYDGYLHAYGLYDQGLDQLAGPRSELFEPDKFRGRVIYRHIQELPQYGLSFQGQFSHLSDINFLESYYKLEFENEPNNETFLYPKWQERNLGVSLLVEPNLRNWVNETQWLPLAEAHWLGISFFDRLTYNAWGSAGYAEVNTVANPDPIRNPGPLLPTTADVETARLNLSQELSVPFRAGPVDVVPYARLDLTYYSQDLFGDDLGRVYGGGGVRSSIPFSRLYRDVSSELFNVQGLYHKVTLGGNYYVAAANEGFDFNTPEPFGPSTYTRLPQLDRLNDDATDAAVRHMRVQYPHFYPDTANTLLNSPIYNPQFYAIRRLVDTRVDTLGDIQVLKLDLNQRLQTKRGYPGLEHTVDWLYLDMSASYFPDSDRDNFGEGVAFVEYDSAWNVGDETALFSSGWFDPYELGARYFQAGVMFSRATRPGPADTFLNLSYRHLDPVESRTVSAALTYRFSKKYLITANTSYDFGIQEAQNNSLILSRAGTDVQLSFGVTYNAILRNFGVAFEIIPNIVAANSGARLQPGGQVFGNRR